MDKKYNNWHTLISSSDIFLFHSLDKLLVGIKIIASIADRVLVGPQITELSNLNASTCVGEETRGGILLRRALWPWGFTDLGYVS